MTNGNRLLAYALAHGVLLRHIVESLERLAPGFADPTVRDVLATRVREELQDMLAGFPADASEVAAAIIRAAQDEAAFVLGTPDVAD